MYLESDKLELVKMIDSYLDEYYKILIFRRFETITNLSHKMLPLDEKVSSLVLEIAELKGDLYENNRLVRLKDYLSNNVNDNLEESYIESSLEKKNPLDENYKNLIIEESFSSYISINKIMYRKLLKVIEEYAFLMNLNMIRKLKNNDINAIVELQNEIIKKEFHKEENEIIEDIHKTFVNSIYNIIKAI